MEKVKKLSIVIGDYEVKYCANGQNNITPEMRNLWEREHAAILEILKKQGIVTDSDSVEKDDLDMNIDLSNELSFEQSVETVKLLEERYDINKFDFQAEYDDWYEENPNLTIIVSTK